MNICSVTDCGAAAKAKGLCMRHYGFLRHNGSPTLIHRPNYGSGFFSRGYRMVSIDGVVTPEHILVAEKSLGKKLPKGAVVHHSDQNKTNNDGSNLVICQSRAYHNLLHTRIDALAACGNANWRKCVMCKSYDAPENLKFPSPPSAKSCAPRHVECEREYRRTGKFSTNLKD